MSAEEVAMQYITDMLTSHLTEGDAAVLENIEHDEKRFLLYALQHFASLKEIAVIDENGYNQFLLMFDQLEYEEMLALTNDCLDFFERIKIKRPSYMLLAKEEINQALLFPVARFAPIG
jgi:hypothetical protein